MITINQESLERLADKLVEANFDKPKDCIEEWEWGNVILDYLQDYYKLDSILTEILDAKIN